MATGFNLNDIVGFTDFIKSLNQSTAQVVGIDLLYFRAVPHKNSESLIFHEYTLLDVECEKQIKGVVKNTDYGNGVEIDLFGVKYDAPLQIQFDLITWIQVFGPNTMPQKDDIVYVPLLNRLFEVSSSTPIYTFINQQTAWQVDMVKYSPKASRAENALLAQTLEESTYSEATLFGDEISKQIADITDIKEFSPYNSVAGPGDWFKEVNNLDHIKNQNVVIRGFHISNGFYDMSSEDFGVSYKNSTDNILDGNYAYSKQYNNYVERFVSKLDVDDGVITSSRVKDGVEYKIAVNMKERPVKVRLDHEMYDVLNDRRISGEIELAGYDTLFVCD